MKRLNQTQRNKLAKQIHSVTNHFHDNIPLADIDNMLADFNLTLIQEDNTKWSGFFCGSEASTTFDLGVLDSENNGIYEVAPNKLYFYWYKHTTGRYEINSYLV